MSLNSILQLYETAKYQLNMLSKREEERRNQLEVVALDELVPDDHLVWKID